jgi:hypothetical protein
MKKLLIFTIFLLFACGDKTQKITIEKEKSEPTIPENIEDIDYSTIEQIDFSQFENETLQTNSKGIMLNRTTPVRFSFTTVAKMRRDLRNGKALEKTHISLNALVRFGAFQLRMHGHPEEADKLLDEWQSEFSPMFLNTKGLGDHEPLSDWLAIWYVTLELLLGETFMKMTHLDDINIINFAIPVVFNPCDPEWDKPEYNLHFTPLAGVLTYWVAWGACVGATYGSGIIFICSAIGSAGEHIMVTFFAPKISDRIYERRCERP